MVEFDGEILKRSTVDSRGYDALSVSLTLFNKIPELFSYDEIAYVCYFMYGACHRNEIDHIDKCLTLVLEMGMEVETACYLHYESVVKIVGDDFLSKMYDFETKYESELKVIHLFSDKYLFGLIFGGVSILFGLYYFGIALILISAVFKQYSRVFYAKHSKQINDQAKGLEFYLMVSDFLRVNI